MADQNTPNDAAQKSKAEGERRNAGKDDMARANQPGSEDRAGGKDEQAGGITNRPLGEEQRSQDAVPDRGASKPGAHAGHGPGESARKDEKR